jgi:hypothetical protein
MGKAVPVSAVPILGDAQRAVIGSIPAEAFTRASCFGTRASGDLSLA